MAKLLIFRLDQYSYALHLSQVDCVLRAVEAAPLPAAPGIVVGVFDLHGEIVSLLSLRKRLGLVLREVDVADVFIIGRTSRRVVGLQVDDVVGIIEHPVKRIVPGDQFCNSPFQIDGAIQLDDGLVLIQDLDRFLAADEECVLDRVLGELQVNAANQ